MAGAYFSLYTGAVLNFVENPETIPENVREIQPTVFLAVPRIWEKFYSGVMIGSGRIHRLREAGLQMGHRRRHEDGRRHEAGQPIGAGLNAALAGPLPGAQQRQQADRHPPLPLADHRRGADLARPGALVHGARRADAGSVGHDGNRRRRHLRRRSSASSPA
jgi:hypothetical protein